ncbi:adenylate kinase [Streptomonospora nanhaiensis]|uniref:adenylate kinase n=1 Tax=Streptomonospora nanhaiensis TaxID=1323731 RepID=UPI0015CCAA41|nr:adenylate kinase [Streptomonospora nanhaiensis]MBV2361874.1 adenylate kinase [Streptomonospora nanhaiensis]MBX9389521.1 adenylate kinase [Streptomonospora nanhaiensis]
MRAVLVGPPGAGKGTQAQILASELSIPKVSTGDIFRANVSGGTELGKQAKAYMDRGDLVPDEVTNAMVRDRLAQQDAQGGFLLDGFPRNVAQAETLNKILDDLGERLDAVLELKVDEEEIVKRLSGRRSCRNCNNVQHVVYDPPATEDVCDVCGGELFQREDDREEVVRHRLDVYHEQTEPLVSFYANEGILVTIEATGPVDEVTARAKAALRNGS